MAKLLYVKSSVFGDGGQSSQLAEQFIEGWKGKKLYMRQPKKKVYADLTRGRYLRS